jgi:hypothetical protein
MSCVCQVNLGHINRKVNRTYSCYCQQQGREDLGASLAIEIDLALKDVAYLIENLVGHDCVSVLAVP